MRGMRDETVSVEDAIGRVEAAHTRVETAARAFAAEDFDEAAEAILQRYVGDTQRAAQQILYVALSGELPPNGEAPAVPDGRDKMLASVREALDSLYVHVREADPEAFLDCTWRHPEFGEMDWRSWLLSLAGDADRCATQLEALHHG